ncbi:MAG: hypothetical protein AAFP77_20435 [Bacteroidota bacterium]
MEKPKEERLRIALAAFKQGRPFTESIGVLRQLAAEGFSEEQVDITLHFFEKEVHFGNEQVSHPNIGSLVNLLFAALIKGEYASKVEVFARQYFADTPYGNLYFYLFFSNKWVNYLGQTIGLGEYDDLFSAINRIHSGVQNEAKEKVHLFLEFMHRINYDRPTMLHSILDDPHSFRGWNLRSNFFSCSGEIIHCQLH